MHAGFAKSNITPPLGTPMIGWGQRDAAGGCTVIHDPLFVRALYLNQRTEEVLILAFDLIFIGRRDADRFKGVLGRELHLLPHQILLNASHTHAGPRSWNFFRGLTKPADEVYLEKVQAAVVQAARTAKANARPATLTAGTGTTRIPISRRRLIKGRMQSAPNPAGLVNDALPVVRLADRRNRTIALVFSISTHPVSFRGHTISADFPGAAIQELDPDHGMFLQGTCGDSRPAQLAHGDAWNWDSGWPETQAIGRQLAAEVRAVKLKPVRPQLRTDLREMFWPLDKLWTPKMLKRELALPAARRYWHNTGDEKLREWLDLEERREHCGTTPTQVPLLLQGIQLGLDLRLVALEGEVVAAHGLAMRRQFPKGVTFALGYSNGDAMYLPTSAMLPEGGYEVECHAIFGWPGRLKKGMERILAKNLRQLRIR
ncbi:MAG: hypothetical protein PCFJNLEI_02112 [Verrucomicrobiae bacterium]|nr:hypothetical protein [Verrucomicrobiae bacterium]